MTLDIPFSGAIAGVCSDVAAFPGQILLPVQTHSCNVAVVSDFRALPDTDGLITQTPGMAIGVRTADCVPLLLYAPDIKAAAAVHAGWRGSLGGICDECIRRLTALGASPQLLQAAFGPCICGQCYQISAELADEFRREGFASCLTGPRNIDLEAVNRQRLLKLGVRPENIRPKPLCTFEAPALPSWRRSPTDTRLLTWIRIDCRTNS